MRTFLLFYMMLFIGCTPKYHWSTAPRDSAGIAPLPEKESEAIVQVYAARTYGWRGYFAVHTWIATKEKNAKEYTTYHVMGWRVRRGGEAVVIENDIPDRLWYGEKPYVVAELKGAKAESAIPKIDEIAKNYYYNKKYKAWPGPNSNTFISHIIRSVPELRVELPPHAIGKDWIHNGDLVGWSETKSGFQVSLYGVLGFTLGLGEGIEVNVLGLTFGVDFLRPAIKLPMIGRIGFKDKPL
jgi:hypothetical protein